MQRMLKIEASGRKSKGKSKRKLIDAMKENIQVDNVTDENVGDKISKI